MKRFLKLQRKLIPFPVKEKEEPSELEKIVPDVGDGWKEIIREMDLDDSTKTGKIYIDSVKREIERIYSNIQISYKTSKGSRTRTNKRSLWYY